MIEDPDRRRSEVCRIQGVRKMAHNLAEFRTDPAEIERRTERKGNLKRAWSRAGRCSVVDTLYQIASARRV